MTLEQLKQLKEKTDSLLFTFQNDRQILQEEKQKREEKINQDFNAFLAELKEYAKMAYLDCQFYTTVLSKELLEEENLVYFRVCVHHDCLLGIYHDKATESITYNLTKDRISIYDEDNYKEFKNTLQKIILKYREKVKETLSKVIELSLVKQLEDEKKINDTLFNQIKDLEK